MFFCEQASCHKNIISPITMRLQVTKTSVRLAVFGCWRSANSIAKKTNPSGKDIFRQPFLSRLDVRSGCFRLYNRRNVGGFADGIMLKVRGSFSWINDFADIPDHLSGGLFFERKCREKSV